MRRITLTALLILALIGGMGSARAGDAPARSRGQTIYVPVYSHITHGNLDGKGQPQTLSLSAMLSVRNTDPDTGLTIRHVRYYDSQGRLIRDFITQPQRLGPMASTEFFVEHKDDSGGAGANFLVEWESGQTMSPPMVETVNAYFFGPHSLAFTSQGKVIAETGK